MWLHVSVQLFSLSSVKCSCLDNARRKFDVNEFGIELRPIVDQTRGRLYWAFNPNIEWALNGPDAGQAARGVRISGSGDQHIFKLILGRRLKH